MSELVSMTFNEDDIRFLNVAGKMWAVGKDICKALGHTNPNKAMGDHCKGVTKRYPIVDRLGRTQEARIINEADIWRLIFSSKLPAAIEFERRVMEEVLPAIRRTGSYTAPGTPTIDPKAMGALLDELWGPDVEDLRKAERRGARRAIKAYGQLARGARHFNVDIYDRLIRYYEMGLTYREMSVLLSASESTLRRWVDRLVEAQLVRRRSSRVSRTGVGR